MILAIVALVVIVVGIPVLICSAHIPGLRSLTGAAPLQDEEPLPPLPMPLDGDPEGQAADVDRNYRSAQAARHARTAADQPHGTIPRRYP